MKIRNKVLICLFLVVTLMSQFCIVNVMAADKTALDVEAKAGLLIEPTTGKVIFEKNVHEKFAPASVTKIMTMLLTMEAVDSGKIKLSDTVVVSENAKKMGGNGSSSMLLDTGEVRTVEDLLKGVAIASGNDAATALAEYIGGSESSFVEMMNKRAQELGMKDTTFKNCHGLSADGHLTSAYDISIMSRELLKHKKILKYSGTYMETISEGRKQPIELVNHNKLVRFYKGCDGLKTGFTNEAKYCISATAVKNNIRMLAIIVGAPTYKIRNRDASMLMNYGFSKFESKKVVTKDTDVEKITLDKKGEKFFFAKAKDDLNLVLERGVKNKITKKCVLDKNKKEYKRGEIIGHCEVYVNDKLLGKAPVYSDRDIKTYGILDSIKYNIMNLFDNAI
ncbi:D-alanyl-D-alanine carboxypeptidase family protein [Clostridium massiliodielmoense]|uniref:D-alanyl-D-alanine carboxypeptidase family protein n=1 Tax=Clostridium massiliodielmoense TaxID=1776385 RepID=UPI0004D738EE|nr:D-alanyl-D-alanine carboxypeptidase family protein [Clostridium massiliodielmoense]KEH97111.1 D-alanyl-D-alanine carboxypeptidase [Clostridium botulinum C/D str. BKT12695]